MSDKIQPGLDDNGRAWCSTECPSYREPADACSPSWCVADDLPARECCEPYYLEKVAELDSEAEDLVESWWDTRRELHERVEAHEEAEHLLRQTTQALDQLVEAVEGFPWGVLHEHEIAALRKANSHAVGWLEALHREEGE